MLTLVVRRSIAQRRLLAGIVVLVTLGTTLLGVGALLLSTTQERAFTAGIGASPARDVDVTAFLVGVPGADAAAVRDEARAVVEDVLGPLRPSSSSSAATRMRRLDGGDLGYLATTDALAQRAELTSGRWPAAAGEAVVPRAAADRLRLSPGDRVTLGAETGTEPADDPVPVVVVGTFRASSASAWAGDPLAGRGFDPAYSNGTVTAPAVGPFVVDEGTLLGSGSTIDALQVTGHPDLTGATEQAVAAAAGDLSSAERLLSARVGDRVDISRIASELPRTLDTARAQQAASRSTVLVVLLLGTAMALTALLLAGRLLAAVRETERALLVELGLGRRQAVAATLGETVVVAIVSTAAAVPAAAWAHSAVTHLPAMRAAGLAQRPAVTAGLVLTEVVCAVLLALALVLPLLRAPAPRGRAADAARTGAGLLLVVAAAAGWWELHSQPATRSSGDVVRTIAPVVCIVAAVAATVRCLPPVLRMLAAIASRSTALAPSLAASQAARRPRSGASFVLLATAVASAIFGLSLQATWDRSQDDQAAVRAGADLALTLTTPATGEDAAAIRTATDGAVGSPVVERPVVLGRYVGDAGAAPQLVAVDSRRAGALLRGRLDQGRTWSSVGDLLAPDARVVGPDLSGPVRMAGTSPAGVTVTLTPTLVVQDDSGFRSAVTADPVELDGRGHTLRGLPRLDPSRLVAVRMQLHGNVDPAAGGDARIAVALAVDGATGAGARADWHVQTLDPDDSPITASAVGDDAAAGGARLRVTAQVDPQFLALTDGALLATTFTTPDVLPVAVSQRLADATGTRVGGELRSTVDGVSVPIEVVAIVPTVPSAPGRATVLADAETLSRMLVGAGRVEPVVDAWWVADPTASTVRALTGLGLGDVVTRTGLADQLQQGPLRAAVPAALIVLVVAACSLLVAGVALVVGADRRTRSAEVARLRALGVTRRAATRLVFTEHAIVLTLLVVVGALVGAVASVAIAPDLVRSDVGTAPVPAAVLHWPWAREMALVAGGLAACLVVAAVLTIGAVRRSGVEQLRTEDS